MVADRVGQPLASPGGVLRRLVVSILQRLTNALPKPRSSATPKPVEPTPPPTEIKQEKVFVARQPIFDRQMTVIGYELLYRDRHSETADVQDNDAATRQTLMHSLIEFGLTELVGDSKAFVNLGPEFIFGGFPFTEYKDRLVLEVLESIKIDMALVRAVGDLRNQGYTIALDEVYIRPEVELLFPVADIVKLDLTLIEPQQLPDAIALVRQHKHLKIVAEKVEQPDVLKRCMDLGFDYFQGFFFAKPAVLTTSRAADSRLAVLRLIAELQNPNVSISEIERLIKQDVSLRFKLLKYINSAMTGVATEIASVRQAITLLGLDRIRVLATLLGLSHANNKPHELLVTALVRARTCELVGQKLRLADPSSLFVVGLFSLLDAMMDQPIETLLGQLPLAEPIREAILHRHGEMGKILARVCQFELGQWNDPTQDAASLTKMRDAYLDAIRWTSALQPDLFYQQG
jgi:EAL and modified HD-GYP domain-containing signal transduction protein